ncbi:hypothetical protein HUJ05_009064 [Dendroctonus ponderosae]|nr:hypothetical protein HUJ05_009064 [Dendroctonus ponderosae]
MIGRAQLACDIDERWNGPPPRCEPVQCEPPLEIPNGLLEVPSNDTVFGSVVAYQCLPGFVLVGADRITCMANGQYDSLPPTCKGAPCKAPIGRHFYEFSAVADDPTVTPAPTTQQVTQSSLPTSIITTLTTRGRTRTPKPPPTTIRAANDGTRQTTRSRRPQTSSTKPNIIVAAHPQDNEIASSANNVQHGGGPNVNVPLPVDGDRQEPFGARLNVGSIIALGTFGAFIFLAAVITTVVILVRSHQCCFFRAVRVRRRDPHTDSPLQARCPPDGTPCWLSRFPISRSGGESSAAVTDRIEPGISVIRCDLVPFLSRKPFFGGHSVHDQWNLVCNKPCPATLFHALELVPNGAIANEVRPCMAGKICALTLLSSAPALHALILRGFSGTLNPSTTLEKVRLTCFFCRNQSAKHYRHRASPDCNTVASFDSSSSESRSGGLNRYYRQAWENLHESAGSKSGHSPLRRKETMDEPYRAREATERHRDSAEIVVSDGAKGEKKRHHHHHHHHKEGRDWSGNRPPPANQKRY